MKLLGAATVAGVLFTIGFAAWRIVSSVEAWFMISGAGNVIGWAFVGAVVLTVFAIPAGAWGLAARMWLVRLHEGERAESAARILAPRRHELPAGDDAPMMTAEEEARLVALVRPNR